MPRLPLAVLPFVLAAAPCQSTDTVWHSDLAAAQKLAAEQKAPLFVTFRCER
ncbi:MAG: hypothetical protein ABIP94_20185 [Planctomycetota bacterium]